MRHVFSLNTVVLVLSFVLLAIAAITKANAGYADTNGVNCAALAGSPYLCIKNQATNPIVAVQVVNTGGIIDSNWINIPGGPIQPQGTSVVKFPTWGSGCQKMLFVRLASGSTHPFNLDVCHASSIRVQW